MKKHLWIILAVLSLTVALTACNTSPEAAEISEPLVVEAKTVSAASTLEEDSHKTEVAYDVSVTETDGNANSDTDSLSVDHLIRVTDAQVIISEADVRQGPGLDYENLGILRMGQLVDVVATNPTQDWILIKSSGLIGWVSLEYMALFDSPHMLPAVLSATPDKNIPAGEIAPIFAVSGNGEPDA